MTTLPDEIYVELAPHEFEGRNYEWGSSQAVDSGEAHCALAHYLREQFPETWFVVNTDKVLFPGSDNFTAYKIPTRSAKLLKINHLRAAIGEGAKRQTFTLRKVG